MPVFHLSSRDPQRTSRILAALQAAAKQAGDEQQAAEVVVQLGPGLQGVIDGVQQAVAAQSDDSAPAPFSGRPLHYPQGAQQSWPPAC